MQSLAKRKAATMAQKLKTLDSGKKKAEDLIENLASTNASLKKEIVHRKAAERSLKKSEQLHRNLLNEARRMQAQLRYISHQILWAQEEERKRISRELHDGVTQTLVHINLNLEILKNTALLSPQNLRTKIRATQKLVEESIDSVHDFARDLRHPVLDHLGLIPTIRVLIADFTKRSGAPVLFTCFAGVERLSSARRTVLYRVIQSALSNVAEHAEASKVEVGIQKIENFVCMTIHDDGKAFDLNALKYRKRDQRLGLLGMRERLEMVGGRFEVKSAPSEGTIITAQIPFGRYAKLAEG